MTAEHSFLPFARLVFAVAAASLGVCPVSAQVPFTGAAYEQDFDTLPLSPGGVVPFTFENNVTLLGWYFSDMRPNNARASSGPRSGGLIYSWGTNKTSDRALGIFFGAGTGGFADVAMLGLQLRNDSGATISGIRLSFDVEQWRSHERPAAWEFSYLVTAAGGDQLRAPGGYVSDLRGDVTSLHTGAGTGLNGNHADNRRSQVLVLGKLDWKPGAYLWLRWVSEQASGASGLGIDNLRVERVGSGDRSTAN